MILAYNLGVLTTRIKRAADAPPIVPQIAGGFPALHAFFGQKQPATTLTSPTSSYFLRRPPTVQKLLGASNPLNTMQAPYIGNETTAKRFVPQQPLPFSPAVAERLIARHYGNDKNPVGDGRAAVYGAANNLYHSHLPLGDLATRGPLPSSGWTALPQIVTRPAGALGSALQTRARNAYEARLKAMRDVAFSQRTTIPFYYQNNPKSVFGSQVGFSDRPIVPSAASPSAASPSAKLHAPVMGLDPLPEIIRKQFPSMVPDTVALHEHAHTTQNVPGFAQNAKRVNAELPATASEIGHAADAYNHATGLWPKGNYFDMPIQELTEDLRRRQHIGGRTTIAEVVNSPEYAARFARMANRERLADLQRERYWRMTPENRTMSEEFDRRTQNWPTRTPTLSEAFGPSAR